MYLYTSDCTDIDVVFDHFKRAEQRAFELQIDTAALPLGFPLFHYSHITHVTILREIRYITFLFTCPSISGKSATYKVSYWKKRIPAIPHFMAAVNSNRGRKKWIKHKGIEWLLQKLAAIIVSFRS